ncbi:hypothetical protein AWZ03_007109 [Drosophila navojoa]|uniref:Transmembrane protein 214 n=1 Tax=Drosophila navojoa TaxID=7232 RepID=A0A484BCB7_DRONA|nr:hypothetical protein AWZ03_007109 [Drosophila navojoa]
MSGTSNQWEVVSKSRKQKNLEKKVTAHTEQKRIAAQLPKLEELLPTQQYRNLFANNNINSSNTNNKSDSPAKSTSSAASASSKSKSPRKTNANAAKSSATDVAKKPPKQAAKARTLEQAMKQITPDDFAAQLEQVKISCPGSQLRWLSNISSYLNSCLAFDCDPTFSGRSAQYPSNLASAALKQSILDFLRSVGETNLEYFFYSLLDSMATELNSGQNVVGYKFVLQLIGQNWPAICSHNMAKTAVLRNSYQNRSNICLSILWAIGQGGHQNLTEGVKVWQNLMLPNLELKSFSKFVVEHIERVLNAAAARKAETLLINQQEFFDCYNALNANYINFSREQQASLKRSAKQLLTVQEKTSAQQKKNKQNAASQKKKCGCCKWTLGSIFIIALIAGALCYDTEVNGKGVFENSATGKVLKNAGVLPQVQRGWYVTMGAGARGYKWAEQHIPPYAQPAIKTGIDVWKIARNACCSAYTNGLNYWRSQWPAVAKFIDQYLPNFSHKLEAFAAGAKDLAINSYDKSATLIKEKVLVGRFSPENINQALNLTRNAALEYYNQFHKKVDAYAKLK